MMRLRAKVSFLSDWSIGTGRGRPGGADAVVARDTDGLPFVPRSSFRGVLRDGVERVALALDEGEPGAWSAFAQALFGRRLVGMAAPVDASAAPTTSLVAVADLRIDPRLRVHLLGPDADGRRVALFSERPAVALDPETGTAKDHNLRWIEVARSGVSVVGQIEVDDSGFDDDQRAAALALLDAGARAIEGLGSNRRRGLGRCNVTLTAQSGPQLDAAAVLRAAPPAAPTPRRHAPSAAEATPPLETTGQPRWFVLSGALETPLVAMAGTRGNVIASHDHLPARSLLPVVAEVLAAAGLDVPTLLRTGQVRVGPGYPGLPGAASLPNPRCLVRDRGSADAHPAARNVAHADLEQATGPTKVTTAGYLATVNGNVHLVESELGLHTHNVIDPTRGRPDRLAGGVYSYQAIAAGTTLCAALMLDASVVDHLDAAHPSWREELGGQRRLGSARQSGYGLITLALTEQEPPRTDGLQAGGSHLLVTASPVVLGAASSPVPPTPMGLSEACRAALVAAGAPQELQLRPSPTPSGRWFWTGTTRIDGWSARDDLPLASIVAIEAGSVVRVEPSHDVPAEVVSSASSTAAGLAGAQGLGWWFVDPEPLQAPSVVLAAHPAEDDASAVGEPSGKLRKPDQRLLTALDNAVVAAGMEEAAVIVGRDPQWRSDVLGWKDATPARSQLGSLRAAVADPAPDALSRWLEERRKDEERFGDRQGATRWDRTLLDRIESLMADPVNKASTSTAYQAAGSALSQRDLPSDHRFARLLLRAALTASGRQRPEASAASADAASVQEVDA